jgi:Helicase conserved C-terminal domain/DEAD/DEAH box helicase
MTSSVQAPLPVDAHVDAVVSLVRAEKRAVILAPPGAGKTTRIPPALTALGRTILLQPRRVAARTLARRIATERNWTLGEEIGWQIRFERRFSARTQLLVATEGILTARLQADPLLSDFSVVILDEFHERSIHADLALALVKQAADTRDDLAVVVMSATMDAAPVARFLGGARVIEIATRTHPIDVRYRNVSMPEAIREVSRDARGHILCFLPGAREIEDVRRAFPQALPLHGSMSVEAQELALAPSRDRKIILSTNVAETSLTVEGVTDVIDSGLQKVLRYDPETAVDHLVLEQISRDSADQRAGRAGRTGPGRATRLWDERMLLRPHREPEVRRVDLASPVLDIFAWGGDPRTFEWYERPPEHRIESAIELLRRLGALEPRVAEQLRRLPLHPRLARVLLDGGEAAVRVCALLSEDVRNIGSGDALTLADSPRLDFAARELSRHVPRGAGAPPAVPPPPRRHRPVAGGTAGEAPAPQAYVWAALVVLVFTYTHLASRYGLPEFVEVRRNASWLAMSLAILLGVATVELLRTRVTKVVAMLVAVLWLWRVPLAGANDKLINYSGYSATAFAVLEIQREHEPFTWTLITYGQEFPMVLGKGFHLAAVDFLDRYDPVRGKLDIPTPYVFIAVEKNPHPFQINTWAARFSREDIQRRLQTWCFLYQRTHHDMHIYRDDENVRVYMIRRNLQSSSR